MSVLTGQRDRKTVSFEMIIRLRSREKSLGCSFLFAAFVTIVDSFIA